MKKNNYMCFLKKYIILAMLLGQVNAVENKSTQRFSQHRDKKNPHVRPTPPEIFVTDVDANCQDTRQMFPKVMNMQHTYMGKSQKNNPLDDNPPKILTPSDEFNRMADMLDKDASKIPGKWSDVPSRSDDSMLLDETMLLDDPMLLDETMPVKTLEDKDKDTGTNASDEQQMQTLNQFLEDYAKIPEGKKEFNRLVTQAIHHQDKSAAQQLQSRADHLFGNDKVDIVELIQLSFS